MVTVRDMTLARQFLVGEITEAELRSELMNGQEAAIIEALKYELANVCQERDDLADDLRAAIRRITVLERHLHHEDARAEA